MINRVSVKGYKSLSNTSLTLQPLTIITGQNAVGKSNLFDALHLLSRIVRTSSLDEAFAEHRGDPLEAFSFEEGGLNGLLAREEASFTIEVDVELSLSTIEQVEKLLQHYRRDSGSEKRSQQITERYLRYRITVAIAPRTGALRVTDEHLEALTRRGDQLYPYERRNLFIGRVGDRFRVRMESHGRYTEHPLGLSYALISQPLHPPYYPHLVAFREEVSRWQFYHFEPRVMRKESPLKATTQISASGDDLAAFYFTLKNSNPGQFDNLTRVLHTLIPTIDRVDAELTQEGKVRLKVNEQGVEFSAKVISEGTLRLLGLLAALSPTNTATTISFEEPESGVNPKCLKLLADLLSNASQHRQVIVNTNSPLLAEHLSSFHLIHCRKEGRATFFEPLYTNELFRSLEVSHALENDMAGARSTSSNLRGLG
ncbi:MAG: AAA family ATPase [Candidatus Methanomethylicaceae archaeon]